MEVVNMVNGDYGDFHQHTEPYSHTGTWTPQPNPQPLPPEFQPLQQEIHRLEAQLEFCKMMVTYGIVDAVKSLPAGDYSDKIIMVEHDQSGIEDELTVLREQAHLMVTTARQGWQNHPNQAQATAVSSSMYGVSHQNQQGAWGFHQDPYHQPPPPTLFGTMMGYGMQRAGLAPQPQYPPQQQYGGY